MQRSLSSFVVAAREPGRRISRHPGSHQQSGGVGLGALVPVTIDREADQGLYVEPNVWMRHRLRG